MRPGALAWALLALLAAIVALRRLDIVQVRGRSMAPALRPGDRLVVVRARPRAGDVVVARDPRAPERELIKRVTSVGRSGVVLRGDNPAASTDSRAFGSLPVTDVQWRAIARYWPPGRMGAIGSGAQVELHRHRK